MCPAPDDEVHDIKVCYKLIISNFNEIKFEIKYDQTWLSMIKHDWSRPNMIKMDQTWPKMIKIDQTWFNMIACGRIRSKLIEYDQMWSSMSKHR